MNLRRYELLVFDWDGTLIDSEASIVRCMQAAIQDLDLPMRQESELRHIIGLGLHEALSSLYPEESDTTYQQLRDRYRYHFLNDEPAQPFPGVDHALTQLDGEGYLMAVATGKGRAGLNKALEDTNFGKLFAASRCADETRSKPHPQMLEELLDQLGVEAANALMIGDTSYDLDMARHAGMDAAAVCTGVHDRDLLLDCEPVVCVERMPDLLHWLKSA